MPRDYFDVENGGRERDETRTDCRDLDEVRAVALRALPGIVADELDGGDRYCMTLAARDEAGAPVFATTLNLTGLWLTGRDDA